MLDLHIYGPALGLPSIDTKCLAAVALLQACLDRDKWRILPSNDSWISPYNELPALRTTIDGNDLWVTGFHNIAAFLETQGHAGRLTLKDDFSFHGSSAEEKAQITAFLSFLESRGLPLLDLSLYVSSDNYTTVTRSALSEILPWPQSWIVPSGLRDGAKKRSEHLGLSGLDVDAVREKELQKENQGVSAAIPKSLRITKKSVTGLLGSNAEQTRFRLEAVTSDFFGPLQELLDRQQWLVGETATPLDCYALAIFAHMKVNNLPQPWLRHALEQYPALHKWTETTSTVLLGASQLPWSAIPTKTWAQLAQGVVDVIADVMPITLFEPRTFAQSGSEVVSTKVSRLQEKQSVYTEVQRYQTLTRDLVAGCGASAGIVGSLVYTGMISLAAWKTQGPSRMDHRFDAHQALFGLR